MSKKPLSKQLPANLITNIVVFVMSTLIGLFLTPFLIKFISAQGFGVIRLALAIPVYVELSTLVISGGVSRFLTIDIQRNDSNAANETFNTAFFAMLGALLLVLPIIFLLSFNASAFFSIPPSLKNDATGLFLGILLSSLIAVFSSMFMIPAFANNRLDISNYIRIAVLSIQTLVIISLVYWYKLPLTSVGIAHFTAAAVGLIISLIVWTRFAPSINLKLSSFSFTKFKQLSSMGLWLVIDQIGTILFLYIDLLVVNYVFGAKATGEYSVLLQWQTMLRSLSSVLASVIAPMIMIHFSKNELEQLKTLSYSSVKFLGLALALPIGLISGFAPVLLNLWVGEAFLHLVPLLWLLIMPMIVNLALVALFPLNTAFNKIRIPAYATLLTGVINFILAFVLTMKFDFGLYGVALASVISFTSRNLIFSVIYTAHITGSKASRYYINLLFGIVTMLMVFGISFFIKDKMPIDSWGILIAYMSLVALTTIIFIYKVILNSLEKQFIHEIINKKFKKNTDRKQEVYESN